MTQLSAPALTVAFITAFTLAAGAQGEVYRPGAGVTLPQVIREVKPDYTDEAKAAGIRGTVWMRVVVKADGKVGDVKVTRSLDSEFGLDDQAVKAAKQWEFKPGTKDGKAVAVEVTIEMTFTLK
jgi:periplasmic protein TonB